MSAPIAAAPHRAAAGRTPMGCSRLFSGSRVRIGQWAKRPEDPAYASPEPSPHLRVVFPAGWQWIKPAGRDPFVADPNSAYFLEPDQSFARAPISPDGDRSYWFELHDAELEPLAAELGSAPATSDATCLSTPVFVRQRVLARRLALQESVEPALIERTVGSILDALVTERRAATATRQVGANGATRLRHRGLVSATKALLAERYAESITLRKLLELLGTSPFHLCRVFRHETGHTLQAYRSQLRLRMAFDRIAGTALDLTTIAAAVGFRRYTHFSSAFGRNFGITPSSLRNLSARRLLDELSTSPDG